MEAGIEDGLLLLFIVYRLTSMYLVITVILIAYFTVVLLLTEFIFRPVFSAATVEFPSLG